MDASASEAARDEDSVKGSEKLLLGLFCDGFRVDPSDVHHRAKGKPGVAQGLRDREVGIVELHILSHKADGHRSAAAFDGSNHRLPLAQIRLGRGQPQLPADHCGQIRLFQIEGGLIENGKGQVLYDTVRLHIAEVRDLAEDFQVCDGLVTAQNNDVRGNPQPLQLFYGVLGGLRFVLSRRFQIGDQSDMDEQGVPRPHLMAYLPDGFNKGLALDIADGPADLSDHNIGRCLAAHIVDKPFDLIRNVRDGLDGGPQIRAPALLRDDVGIDLSGGQVGVLVQILIDEALVVPQIQIRLSPVLGDIDLTVLIGTHSARIHIDVWVQLLGCYLQPPGLQQSPQ